MSTETCLEVLMDWHNWRAAQERIGDRGKALFWSCEYVAGWQDLLHEGGFPLFAGLLWTDHVPEEELASLPEAVRDGYMGAPEADDSVFWDEHIFYEPALQSEVRRLPDLELPSDPNTLGFRDLPEQKAGLVDFYSLCFELYEAGIFFLLRCRLG